MTALKEALCGDEGVAVNDFCLGWVNTKGHTTRPVDHTCSAKADAATSPL